MPRELRFTDPAFRCEVVLSGAAMALYDTAHLQFERLKGIKNLGITAHVHDVAMHTRHQHLVGLMRIFNKLCQQPKDKGLPKSFLWSFWPRLCFAQTGHAALSYDSEKAVLLACHLDSKIKGHLRELLQPVIDMLTPCTTCKKQCLVKDKGRDEGNEWFENLVQENRWSRLYLWIGALKLVQEPKLMPILKEQKVGKENSLGFSEAEVFKMLVAPGCKWDRVFRNLRRLDFIVRDLAFAGTLGIQLDVDTLVGAADDDHVDWKLLNSLSSYMSDTLYDSIGAQTASVLFQRALAEFLIKGKIPLEVLFGIESDGALNDDGLRDMMQRTAVGREVFDTNRRQSWRAWPINTFIDENRIPCEVEREITAYKKGHLSQHTVNRATCFKMRQDHMLAIAISHHSLVDRPDAKAFVKLCRAVLNNQYPKLVSGELTVALFEGLIDRLCQHSLNSATERLSLLPVRIETLKRAADVVNNRASGKTDPSKVFSFKIEGYEYPFRGDPQEFQINTMHAALSGNEQVRKNLGINKEIASEILWDELLRWQTIYFGLRPTQKIVSLATEAQEHLARKVISGATSAPGDLELYALLEALKFPRKGVSFRISLPNLKMLKEDGTVENEYDVVSLALRENKDVEVWVWGVTTEADLGPKRTADFGKIQKLKDLLGGRWEADVRVVTCYVHKDGNAICCEIDGRQERRTYVTST